MSNHIPQERQKLFKYLEDNRELMNKLFSRTVENEALKNFTQWAPIDWLIARSNSDAGNFGDNGLWSNPSLLELEDLYSNIFSEGMRDPLILGVGLKSRKVRLETGNHRIQVFKTKGIQWVPVVALCNDSGIINPSNGSHTGLNSLLSVAWTPKDELLGPYYPVNYARPSWVLIGEPLFNAALE